MKQTGTGVQILVGSLPTKSPWLNAIEPHWVRSQRKVIEPHRLLPARELAERVCACFDCPYEPHVTLPKDVA